MGIIKGGLVEFVAFLKLVYSAYFESVVQYLCLSFRGSRLPVQLFKLDVLIQKILQMKVLVCVLFTSSRHALRLFLIYCIVNRIHLYWR